MHVVEVSKPLYGAAYRVLFQRFEPMNCFSQERFAEIKAGLTSLEPWFQQQSADVSEAYRWAASGIVAEIEKRFQVNELGNQINAAYVAIPKPE